MTTLSPTTTAVTQSPDRGRRGALARGLTQLSRFGFVVALVALLVVAFTAFPEFRTLDNILNMLSFSAILFMLSLGETLVVIGRGVDLSVGSMTCLCGGLFYVLLRDGIPTALSILICLAAGAAIGAVLQGLIITKLKISFLIVTLGMYTLLRSQGQVLLGGRSQTIYVPFLDSLANNRTWGIPNLVYLAAGIYLLTVLILRCTSYGRALYATGANPTAARLSGVPVDRVIVLAYGFSGLIAMLAGLLLIGQLGSAQPDSGSGLELSAIAAVLLGGTRFSGGYGSATRTLFGVVFLAVLDNVLTVAGVSSFWQGTASGLVLIGAVGLDRARKE